MHASTTPAMPATSARGVTLAISIVTDTVANRSLSLVLYCCNLHIDWMCPWLSLSCSLHLNSLVGCGSQPQLNQQAMEEIAQQAEDEDDADLRRSMKHSLAGTYFVAKLLYSKSHYALSHYLPLTELNNMRSADILDAS